MSPPAIPTGSRRRELLQGELARVLRSPPTTRRVRGFRRSPLPPRAISPRYRDDRSEPCASFPAHAAADAFARAQSVKNLLGRLNISDPTCSLPAPRFLPPAYTDRACVQRLLSPSPPNSHSRVAPALFRASRREAFRSTAPASSRRSFAMPGSLSASKSDIHRPPRPTPARLFRRWPPSSR